MTALKRGGDKGQSKMAYATLSRPLRHLLKQEAKADISSGVEKWKGTGDNVRLGVYWSHLARLSHPC
jgi:hypothetical protein